MYSITGWTWLFQLDFKTYAQFQLLKNALLLSAVDFWSSLMCKRSILSDCVNDWSNDLRRTTIKIENYVIFPVKVSGQIIAFSSHKILCRIYSFKKLKVSAVLASKVWLVHGFVVVHCWYKHCSQRCFLVTAWHLPLILHINVLVYLCF